MKKKTLFLIPFLLLMSCHYQKIAAFQRETVSSVQKKVKILSRAYVFDHNEEFSQSHASTLINTDDGNFLVAWFGGTAEGNNDVAIWLSIGQSDNWSPPVKVAKINDQPHWNPVLFKTATGEIILYFKVGSSPSNWSTWYQTSKDNGKSWNEAQLLGAGTKLARGPVRAKPIRLSDGSWLAGSSDEAEGHWNVFVDRSSDKGRTWQASAFISIDRRLVTDRGVIQPTLWESSPGIVHMLTRSTEDYIFRSDSQDYGKTWSKLYKISLPNNNSGIDVSKLDDKDGTLVLVFNNLSTDGVRTPINLAISTDNGKTWPTVIELEHAIGSEFSYPSVVHVGNKVYGTYTWNRKRIAFWSAEILTNLSSG